MGGNNGFVYNKTTYDLTLLGLIRGSNIHTNTISQSTKLGQLTGFFEDETTQRNNSFIGYQAGRYIYTGSGNTFIGSFSGSKQAGGSSNNTFIGYLSGGKGDSSKASNRAKPVRAVPCCWINWLKAGCAVVSKAWNRVSSAARLVAQTVV